MTIDDWRVRYDGLNAEADRIRAEAADLRKRLDVALFLVDALRAHYKGLRMRVTPEVIGDKHKRGDTWLCYFPECYGWARVYFSERWQYWQSPDGAYLLGTPTHALPMPPAPEVTNDAE